MNQQAAAIVIAGALMAVAIMLTNRWTLISTPNSVRTDALLLNRGQALLMSASQRHRWGRCIVVRHDGVRAPKAEPAPPTTNRGPFR